MSELRITEIFKEEIWERVEFRSLKVNDRVRLFESSDNEPVKDKEGNYEFIVTSEPKPHEGNMNNYEIEAKPYHDKI